MNCTAKVKCCFCGKLIESIEANNAQPLKDGECCDECNMNLVIPARIAQALNSNIANGSVER